MGGPKTAGHRIMLSGCGGEDQMTEVTGGEEYWFIERLVT
jgi:hypothetical protein